MKRFLIFVPAGLDGGWNDYVSDHDLEDEAFDHARSHARAKEKDVQVVDTRDGTVSLVFYHHASDSYKIDSLEFKEFRGI